MNINEDGEVEMTMAEWREHAEAVQRGDVDAIKLACEISARSAAARAKYDETPMADIFDFESPSHRNAVEDAGRGGQLP